jgi:signal transduction histidine kinase
LVNSLFQIEGGIDQLLFTAKLTGPLNPIPNRMAPNTAFNFILTGISLLVYKSGSNNRAKSSQFLVLITALISLLSIIGYVYGVRSFYGVLTYIPMALNTSFCFLMLSAAVLLISSDTGLMAGYTDNYTGTLLARKLIPAIIVIPVLLGLIILYGEKSGLYIPHFGFALFTAANILIFIFLINKVQSSLNESDLARTEAEKKLIELNARLEENAASLQVLNTELESFSYSISHDLKSPLRAIQGYSKILQEDYSKVLDQEGLRQLNIIIAGVQKMNQLIDDLLAFARIRREELKTAHCDMKSLVKNVLKEQYFALKQKEYEIKIDELFSCSGDPKMIALVWGNLISNALKYSGKKEKPIIEIGSFKDQENTVYYVKDNGDGFDMKYSNKLFAVFQRLHSENEFEGTGIGLAIAHKIITRHGGKIWANSRKDEGAHFYFSLPVNKVTH